MERQLLSPDHLSEWVEMGSACILCVGTDLEFWWWRRSTVQQFLYLSWQRVGMRVGVEEPPGCWFFGMSMLRIWGSSGLRDCPDKHGAVPTRLSQQHTLDLGFSPRQEEGDLKAEYVTSILLSWLECCWDWDLHHPFAFARPPIKMDCPPSPLRMLMDFRRIFYHSYDWCSCWSPVWFEECRCGLDSWQNCPQASCPNLESPTLHSRTQNWHFHLSSFHICVVKKKKSWANIIRRYLSEQCQNQFIA